MPAITLKYIDRCIDYQPLPFDSLDNMPYDLGGIYNIEMNDRIMVLRGKPRKLKDILKATLSILCFPYAIIGIITGIVLIYVLSSTDYNYNNILFVLVLILGFFFVLFAIAFIIMFLEMRESFSYTFSRMSGVVTYTYKSITTKTSFEFNFKEVRWHEYMLKYHSFRTARSFEHGPHFGVKDHRLEETPLLEIPNPELWSFFVWYMDHNRPLPPGKIFDPYRYKDYLRRKKKHFPAPLYRSKISMKKLDEVYSKV